MPKQVRGSFARTYPVDASTAATAKTVDPGPQTKGNAASKHADGFIAHADGTVYYQCPGDSSDKQIPVVAGGHYTIVIKSIGSSTDCALTLGWF